MIQNPLANKDAPQELSWKHLEIGKFSFELIQPIKAVVDEYGEGGYLRFCAEVKEDHKDLLIKGDFVLLNLPVRTFMRAWNSKPYQFRRQIEDLNNVYIEFSKSSRESLTIHKAERLIPKPEHIEFASKNYEKPKKEVEEI